MRRFDYHLNEHAGKAWMDDQGLVHLVIGENGQHHLMACGAGKDLDDYPEFFNGVEVTCLGCVANAPTSST